LQLEAGGPTAQVTSMAFSSDGKTLYVAGLDKVVRVWSRDAKDQRFEPINAYRVPIGAGMEGALNAVAISADGKWLAAGGSGARRLSAGLREPGLVWLPSTEALSTDMQQDQGTIYVFNTIDGTVRRLRGHAGTIWALQFVQGANAPLLASAAKRWVPAEKKYQVDLRLWHAELEKDRGEAPTAKMPLVDASGPIGLAAWSSGGEMHVVLAAGDGRTRLWDVKSGKVIDAADEKNNSTALYLPDRHRLLTSTPIKSKDGWRARLRTWKAEDGKLTEVDSWTKGDGTSIFWPLTLAPVVSNTGKVEFVAAVCLEEWLDRGEVKRQFWLSLFDPKEGTILHEQLLWDIGTGPFEQPVLAVGPRGRHLAVAGNPEHTVHVFAVDDLVEKKATPARQVFHSAGTTVNLVRWAKKDGELGLSLRTTTGTDWVFEFLDKPRLTQSAEGWRVAGADKVPQDDLKRWSDRHPGTPQVTSAAILPAGALLKDRRLLAVGYRSGGDPALGLYDADTGDQVRELTGHLGVITSLAFSEDGKRLASASEDQTVSVWDLADVPDLLTRRGMLRGVFAVDRAGQKGQLVRRVEPGSSAADKLDAGTVLLGIVENKKLLQFDTARDFYLALSERKPGERVTLRPAKGKDLTLTLDPGIDERKPLLSLFVTRDQDWIGWSPIGAYESSGPKAESYIGWHIGTDKPERPITFALAKEYHKEYHKDGALRELMRTGKVAPPKPPAPPKPRMTLWIGEPKAGPAERDAQGRYVLPRKAATLHLLVEDFPRDLIKSVTWQLDVGQDQDISPVGDQDWTGDLGAKMDDKRILHLVRATLKTRGEDSRKYQAEIGFRYQPPPPELTLLEAGGQKPATADQPIRLESKITDFVVKYEVAPGAVGEYAAVKVSHSHRDKAASPTHNQSANKRMKLEHQLKLVKGLNIIEILALNGGPWSTNLLESRRIVMHVEFEPDPVRIVLWKIEPLKGGVPQRLDVKGHEAVTVHSPRVRITGVVETKGKPKVQWQIEKEKLLDLPLDKDHKFSLDLPELKPGTQRVTFQASTEGVNTDSASVSIRFAPLPPTITLTEPEAVYEGQHKGDVIVQGKLQIPEVSADYKYRSTVLGKGLGPLGASVEVDEKTQNVIVKTPFEPGEAYSIYVSLTNEWGEATQSNRVLVRCWSPPTAIKFVDVPKEVREPLLNLRATITSRLPLTRVEARVQSSTGEDTPIPAIEIKRGSAENTWDVFLKAVPLTQGRNTVRLSAANEQGQIAKPGEITIQYKEPVDPPLVEILGPTSDKVPTREYEVKFAVHSKAPLKLVEIVQGKERRRIDRDVTKIAANDEGSYDLKESVKVKLQSGINVLKVMAVNEGGQNSAPIQISCVPVPVRMEVDALLTPEGAAVELKHEANGAVMALRAPTPRLRVKGRIIWDNPDDPLLSKDELMVRVYVNGFQQRPAELQAASTGKAERPFESDILLNRLEDNRIEFELPSLKRNNENRPSFVVAKCSSFKQDQWLHLLIIGAGEESRDTLLQSVLKAMNARKENDTWGTDVFSCIKTYGPLTKADHNLGPEYIHNQLFTIRETMRGRQAAGAGDIVLIYFKGGELIDKTKGHLLLTGSQSGMSLASTELANFFTNSRGANLLFLDVERPDQTATGVDQFKDRWPHESNVSRVGVFRSGQQAKTLLANDSNTARLDRALQEEMPKAQALGDLETSLKAKYKTLADQHPELRMLSHFYVYPLLEDVVINRRAGN
jgi:WD40 repeat protein